MSERELNPVLDGGKAPVHVVSGKSGKPSRLRRSKRHYLEAWALPGLLVAIAVFFSLWPETSDTFPTAANFKTIVAANAVVAIVALGALIPLVCFEFDLSIGAITGLSSIFVASALAGGSGVAVVLLLGIGIGVLVGTVNALLVTRLGVNAVITTLGVSIVIAGVINLKTSGVGISGDFPQVLTDFGTESWFGIPRPAFALAFIAIATYYLLNHTPYGRELYAMGSNRAASKLVGIRTKLVLGMTFVIGGALCGFAGVLQVARSGGADPRLGDNLTMPALAAAFLSAAAIRPGRYNVGGTLVAVFFLAVLNSGLNLAGAEEYISSFVNGAALIIGVGLAVRLGGREQT